MLPVNPSSIFFLDPPLLATSHWTVVDTNKNTAEKKWCGTKLTPKLNVSAKFKTLIMPDFKMMPKMPTQSRRCQTSFKNECHRFDLFVV